MDRRAWLLLLAMGGGACGGDGKSQAFEDAGALEDGASPQYDASATDGGGRDAGDSGTAADGGDGPEEKLSGNGFPMSQHCLPNPKEYIDLLGGCSGDKLNTVSAAGIRVGEDDEYLVRVNTMELPLPMRAGEPYALSTELSVTDPDTERDFEVWGVMSHCAASGETAALLGTFAMDRKKGVYCLELMPDQSYTHVLFVFRQYHKSVHAISGFGLHGRCICQQGSCPAP